MKLENITTTVSEPVAVELAKQHFRVDSSDEDILISRYITGAREYAENYAEQIIAQQQFRLTLNEFPDVFDIPKTPLISIDSLTYTDINGSGQSLTSSDYELQYQDKDVHLIPAYNTAWPTTENGYDKVVLTFTAGMSAITESVKLAILFIAADMFSKRENSAPVQFYNAPISAQQLLRGVAKWR